MNNMLKKDRIDNYFIGYLFFVLFCPPIFSKYINVFLIIIYTIIVSILKYKNDMRECLRHIAINKTMVSLVFLFFYFMMVALINILFSNMQEIDKILKPIYRFIMLFSTVYIFVPYIICYSKRKGYSKDDVIKYIIYACSIQFVILAVYMLFPNIRSIALNVMYTNLGVSKYTVSYAGTKRFYGFALALLDGFSYGIGMAAVLALYYSRKYGIKYIILFIELTIVSIFNGRSGLVIILVGCGVILLKKGKGQLRTIMVLLSGALLLLLIMHRYFETNYMWLKAGLLQLRDFVFQREYGDYGQAVGNSIKALFNDNFWAFPSDFFQLVFGAGHSPIGNAVTDVGYVNYIWIFGILGTVILFWNPVLLYLNIRNRVDKYYRQLMLFVLIAMFLGNIKFDFFTYGPFLEIFYLVIITGYLISGNEAECGRNISHQVGLLQHREK